MPRYDPWGGRVLPQLQGFQGAPLGRYPEVPASRNTPRRPRRPTATPSTQPRIAMAGTQPLAVVAVGGNALSVSPRRQAIPDQAAAAAVTAGHILDIIAAGWRVVITHGNGPQVGHILRRSELALHELPPTPMDAAGAETQGLIGYLLQRALHNALRRREIAREVTTVLTQVQVTLDDPAFTTPTKPIGSRMPEAEARRHAAKHG